MKVLGINGWRDITHDASAALIVDGNLVGLIEEERLNRIRYAPDTSPQRAVSVLLGQAGLSLADVDILAVGWNLPGYYGGKHGGWTTSNAAFVMEATGSSSASLPRVQWYDHHLAHAASVFVQSGLEDAAILVVDGQGEHDAISIYRGEGGEVRLLCRWSAAYSLGWLYEAATVHCGFQSYNAGKTMGLAAYGRAVSDFEPITWRDGDLGTTCPESYQEQDVADFFLRSIEERFDRSSSSRFSMNPITLRRATFDDEPAARSPDTAATVQRVVETTIRRLAIEALHQANSSNLCLTGGVALNCVANGKLLDLTDQLFVQPFANDAGAALGAAALASRREGVPVVGPFDAYLGPSFRAHDVAEFLRSQGIPFRMAEDPAEAAAQLLMRGCVIGWFQGRMEAGPRALGGRSILALPAPASMRDRVNRIKDREKWRPLAPSLLREEMMRFFGVDRDAPYMLLSLPLTPEGRELAPALVHIDGSARPQSVDANGGAFRRLLLRIKQLTGIGLLLNTSFNGPDEPLVCTPEHAVRTFFAMSLDALVIENCVIEKPASSMESR